MCQRHGVLHPMRNWLITSITILLGDMSFLVPMKTNMRRQP